MNQKGFAPILIVVVILAIFLAGYLVYQNQSTRSRRLIFTDTASWGWKSYTIQKIGLSMQYPPNWNVLEIKYPSSPDEEIRFEGPEGRISVRLGTGFGGGCPIPIIIEISGQELAGCKSGDINEQYLSFSKETNIPIDLGNGTQGKLSLQVDAYAAPPGQINLNTILKIISTFRFTQ